MKDKYLPVCEIWNIKPMKNVGSNFSAVFQLPKELSILRTFRRKSINWKLLSANCCPSFQFPSRFNYPVFTLIMSFWKQSYRIVSPGIACNTDSITFDSRLIEIVISNLSFWRLSSNIGFWSFLIISHWKLIFGDKKQQFHFVQLEYWRNWDE